MFARSIKIFLLLSNSACVAKKHRYDIFQLMAIAGVLPYIQVVLSVLLVACILLQQTGAGLGGAFGGDNFSAGYHTRRGAEKYLFYATMVLAVLFGATSFLALLLQ